MYYFLSLNCKIQNQNENEHKTKQIGYGGNLCRAFVCAVYVIMSAITHICPHLTNLLSRVLPCTVPTELICSHAQIEHTNRTHANISSALCCDVFAKQI